jgi:hypothetical protein
MGRESGNAPPPFTRNVVKTAHCSRENAVFNPAEAPGGLAQAVLIGPVPLMHGASAGWKWVFFERNAGQMPLMFNFANGALNFSFSWGEFSWGALGGMLNSIIAVLIA